MADETQSSEYEVGQMVYVYMDGWAGRSRYEASVVKVTPKRLLVRWNQWTPKGERDTQAYVPKRSVAKASFDPR